MTHSFSSLALVETASEGRLFKVVRRIISEVKAGPGRPPFSGIIHGPALQ